MGEVRAVGIDPSLTGTGVATSDGRCNSYGFPGITAMSWVQQHNTIQLISDNVLEIAQRFQPDVVVIESLDVSHAYGGIIPRVVLWDQIVQGLYLMFGARVLLAASTHRMRYATGKAAAKKTEVVHAVAIQLSMFQTGGDDNKADAAVFCAMGMDYLGQPLTRMPAANRKALEGLRGIADPPKLKTRSKT